MKPAVQKRREPREPNDIHIGFLLPRSLRDALHQAADASYSSVGAVLRGVLREWAARQEPKPNTTTTDHPAPTKRGVVQ